MLFTEGSPKVLSVIHALVVLGYLYSVVTVRLRSYPQSNLALATSHIEPVVKVA